MIRKPFHDLNLSTLGMGNMRLPTVGERGPIDEEKAREIIEYAYEHGINYFDTAYGYHGGESERFVGKVLNQYPRETLAFGHRKIRTFVCASRSIGRAGTRASCGGPRRA